MCFMSSGRTKTRSGLFLWRICASGSCRTPANRYRINFLVMWRSFSQLHRYHRANGVKRTACKQANAAASPCVSTVLSGVIQPHRAEDQGLQDGEQGQSGAGQTPVLPAECRQRGRARQLDGRHQVRARVRTKWSDRPNSMLESFW